MGVLIDLLTSENFRKYPMMHTGYREFNHISSWLRGFESCYNRLRPGEPPELEGFREFLHVRLNGPGNTDWQGIIENVFGSGEEATEKAFECLDEFLRYRDEVGINQIIDEHESYEIRRYGQINSGTLKRR